MPEPSYGGSVVRKMPEPRIKIYTRSFDLKLYRLAKGLFDDLRDADGNPIGIRSMGFQCAP